MRRSSTRKSTSGANASGASATSYGSSGLDLFRSASSKAAAKEQERIDSLFGQYADRDSDGMIGPEGIERLCNDLGVEVTDVRILMLAWKMGAAKQGYFSLNEWQKGLKSLKVDTIEKLKKALSTLEHEVWKPQNFYEFYTYAFKYCLTEEKQKSLDLESACELLELVLGDKYPSQVSSLMEYLKKEYKAINLDQWSSFKRFFDEIQYPDFSNYDPSMAWPLLLDHYVEWVQGKET